MGNLKEKNIQDWLENIIKNGDITKIINRFKLDLIIRTVRNPDKYPEFRVDMLMRKKTALAADYILDNLDNLELVSGDENISKTQKEKLRPDIIAYNPEHETLIVFELKKDSQTARQAITELLAYEHEIQNYLPFSSSLDIIFVIVSKEWSTLLDHSLANLNTWSQKRVLGLQIEMPDEADALTWDLHVHIPDSWQRLKCPPLPHNSISTVTLCLYPKASNNNQTILDEVKKSCLISAMSLIAVSGERTGSNGFAILWNNTYDDRMCDYLITVAYLNPFAYFQFGVAQEPDEKNPFVKFFHDRQGDLETRFPRSFIEITRAAREHLTQYFDVRIEGYSNWENEMEILPQTSLPFMVEFWGEIGEYARVMGSAHNDQTFVGLVKQGFNWHDPSVAIPLIHDICGRNRIPNSVLTTSICFQIGFVLGKNQGVNQYFNYFKNNTEEHALIHKYESMTCWYGFDLIQILNEIGYILDSLSCQVPPPPILTINDTSQLIDQIIPYLLWLSNNLIGDNYVIHQFSLMVGFLSADFLEPSLLDFKDESELLENWTLLKKYLGATGRQTMDCFQTKIKDKSMPEDLLELGMAVKRIFGEFDLLVEGNVSLRRIQELLYLLPEPLFTLYDSLFPPVWLARQPLENVPIDIEEFQKEVFALVQAGEKYVALYHESDGVVWVGSCQSAEISHFSALDYTKEVFLITRYGGYDRIEKISWEMLVNGISS